MHTRRLTCTVTAADCGLARGLVRGPSSSVGCCMATSVTACGPGMSCASWLFDRRFDRRGELHLARHAQSGTRSRPPLASHLPVQSRTCCSSSTRGGNSAARAAGSAPQPRLQPPSQKNASVPPTHAPRQAPTRPVPSLETALARRLSEGVTGVRGSAGKPRPPPPASSDRLGAVTGEGILHSCFAPSARSVALAGQAGGSCGQAKAISGEIRQYILPQGWGPLLEEVSVRGVAGRLPVRRPARVLWDASCLFL
jgi:hypothetical protein